MDAKVGKNPQTGSPYLVVELADYKFLYVEWHKSHIIIAGESEDEGYCAEARPIHPGTFLETTGHSCIDDALDALEDEFTSVLGDWYAPPNLGI